MQYFKFKIVGKNPNKKCTIYISFRFGRNDKLMYRTPLMIEPKFWNSELGRAKNTIQNLCAQDINYALQSLDGIINGFLSSYTVNGTPITKETIKLALDTHFGKEVPTEEPKEGKGEMDFHTFFEKFIELCKTRMNNRRGGQLLSYKTSREYARTYRYVLDYERSANLHVEFDDINQAFIDGFVTYLQSLKLATNTIGHKITCIKALMRSAFEQELTTNHKFQFIKNQTEESDSVALTEEEIQQLVDLDLSKNARLERARDLFIVGCWTGLRFSDVSKLHKEHIGDDGIINITQTKTNHNVYIPLHPIVKEILEKYNYQLPELSNQKFNQYIKEVCHLAKIDKSFMKSITRGGVKETTTYKKWQIVSSHTARRSFATNLYLSGFPSISIMAITGHRTEAAFLKYIKVSRAEHAKKLMEYWQNNR